MERISVTINEDRSGTTYPLFIGSGILKNLPQLIDLGQYSRILIFVDKNVPADVMVPIDWNRNGIVVESVDVNEASKNLDGVKELWDSIVNANLDRHSLVINVGGGVLGDMGGFAASTYMRGIDFLQVPTTLLAQADASIGGKVGMNFRGIKNTIGSFQQPIAVIADVALLRSLPKREFVAGFAEIAKHGFIRSRDLLETILDCSDLILSRTAASEAALVKLLARSCLIKAEIVEEDERESSGTRKILNFGHTFGHAFESLSHDHESPLLHGEAISIGMVAEARLSQLVGLLDASGFEQVLNTLRRIGLPTSLDLPIAADDVRRKIQADKKNVAGRVKWSLLRGVGNCLPDIEAPQEAVSAAMQDVCSQLSQ